MGESLTAQGAGKNGRRPFLPVSKQEMDERGWDYYDFLFVSGDAYVDHPSFGTAVLSRLLESEGYRVAILAQPDWRSAAAFAEMGRPRLGVMISGGVIDSMVNHYTAAKKPREKDAYSPGGARGRRPDRCTIVYSNRVREALGDIPIIIGGVEASLRRFAHYDYHSDKVRRGILLDAQADFLSFGMGERAIVELADILARGELTSARFSPPRGVCFLSDFAPRGAVILPSFEEVRADKEKYALAARVAQDEQDFARGKTLAQKHGGQYVVQTPPQAPLSQSEMDKVYALPYTRKYHPSYETKGGVPALEEVQFSITSSRGCFGACNFCALTFHQGRVVQSRSHDSIVEEAKALTEDPAFKGYIHDVGGPTANFRAPACQKQLTHGACRDRQCLFPEICENAEVSHADYLALLRKIRGLPKIKKVFIRSGIRYDYLIADKDGAFFRELCEHHVSGQLKVAPEHVSDGVLRAMGKPPEKIYRRFCEKFTEINRRLKKKQYLVPYLMSSHPGSTLKDAVELALYLKKNNIRPQQVQDFYPTPGTLSTAMFYTGIDPKTMKKISVPKTAHEKALQRALLQASLPQNRALVKEALTKAGRADLIGFLLTPERRPDNGDNFGRKGFGGKGQGGASRGVRHAQSKRDPSRPGGHHSGR